MALSDWGRLFPKRMFIAASVLTVSSVPWMALHLDLHLEHHRHDAVNVLPIQGIVNVLPTQRTVYPLSPELQLQMSHSPPLPHDSLESLSSPLLQHHPFQSVAEPNMAVPKISPKPSVHVIFSTDCSAFQNWQSIVMYYSSDAVAQPGPITRIASGCSDSEQSVLLEMHRKLSRPNFRIHFTPDFSKDPKTGKTYLFFNKPHGLLHWLRHGNFNESTVALLDPDMVFLRPITGTFESFLTSPDWKGEHWERVEKGRPAGQQYGLGDYWMTFKREYICGPSSPCVTTSRRDANKYFPVGPPYVLHVDDLRSLAQEWVRMVPKIYEEYPELLAEMYAYSMAAAHLNLRHFKVDHMMVSNVDAGGEGWPWVDSFMASQNVSAFLAGSFAVAKSTVSLGDEAAGSATLFDGLMPSVLHLCQNYRIGDWLFAKRRVPKGEKVAWPPPAESILSCSHPLLAVPPPSLGSVHSFTHNDGTQKPLGKAQQARTLFVVTTAIRGLNSALEAFKRDVCGGSMGPANLSRSFRLVPEHVERKQLAEQRRAQLQLSKLKKKKGR